jgi:hypothetical protein
MAKGETLKTTKITIEAGSQVRSAFRRYLIDTALKFRWENPKQSVLQQSQLNAHHSSFPRSIGCETTPT